MTYIHVLQTTLRGKQVDSKTWTLQALGLMESYNSTTAQLTVFAPLNSAFQGSAGKVSMQMCHMGAEMHAVNCPVALVCQRGGAVH